jgi:16S rRNA U1498 N3-methylase RsmE
VQAEHAAIGVRAAAAQVFVDDPSAARLAAADAHNLSRVLRLCAGEEVIARDGAGHWSRTRWMGERGEAPGLEPLRGVPGPGGNGVVQFEAASAPALTVAFAPTKGERAEWVVQKLTELGVDLLGTNIRLAI